MAPRTVGPVALLANGDTDDVAQHGLNGETNSLGWPTATRGCIRNLMSSLFRALQNREVKDLVNIVAPEGIAPIVRRLEEWRAVGALSLFLGP